jgi:hypothetical protein
VHDKVELFERIRRDHALHGWGIRELARQHACHRRDVGLALRQAEPPPRKLRSYPEPALEPWKPTIDAILEADREAPRKQRHTAHRIWTRLHEEHQAEISERTVRAYVRRRRRQLGGVREVMVPQHHEPGREAEVDMGESWVRFPEGEEKVDIFTMRACASGAPFHWPLRRLTQQAFLEPHVEAFARGRALAGGSSQMSSSRQKASRMVPRSARLPLQYLSASSAASSYRSPIRMRPSAAWDGGLAPVGIPGDGTMAPWSDSC